MLILSLMISCPNYNQQISIDVDHIDLTFEVQNEKVDTLKETFIRILKKK